MAFRGTRLHIIAPWEVSDSTPVFSLLNPLQCLSTASIDAAFDSNVVLPVPLLQFSVHWCILWCWCFAFSSVAVYCAFPVITSSIAVITVEMVITILATDFYCNFCKTHSATNINVTSFSWFQNRMSGGFYHLQQLGVLSTMVHQLALVGAIKSAMLWIFLLYGAQ